MNNANNRSSQKERSKLMAAKKSPRVNENNHTRYYVFS